MNPETPDLLKQLHDIEGLQPVSIWPPAPGWWLVALVTLLVVAVLVWWWRRPSPAQREAKRWQQAAREALRRIPLLSQSEQIPALTQTLRRIAMARYGRETCAGLHGTAWLQWLQAHDPMQFDWETHGQVLVDYYQPQVNTLDTTGLDKLLRAAKAWVDS